MQQRRVRLGDVLDDYCPRERRITNHAVVAMIEDDVKQTRCSTCDAEHEYKHAKVPAPRRKKPAAAAALPPVEAADSMLAVAEEDVATVLDDTVDESPALSAHAEGEAADVSTEPEPVASEESPSSGPEDEWPVHRPLIRATLPRPEGQVPERKPTDFTIRQTGGRFEGQRNGNKSRGNRHGRQAQGHASGQPRFDNSRPGSSRQGGGQHTGGQPRHGNRQGQGPQSGQRGGRPGQSGGHNRGGGGGQGRGPKRGR